MTDSLSYELQAKTLATIDRQPPVELLFLSQTDDQRLHWAEIYQGYQWLGQSFREYFSGQGSSHAQFPKATANFYGALRDWYLAFYALVQWNWDVIECAARESGVDLSRHARSPGEGLLLAIELDALGCFHPALVGYFRWTPNRIRELVKLEREISREISVACVSVELSNNKKATAKLKRYESALKQSRKEFGAFASFRQTCVQIVFQEAVKGDQMAERHLKNYCVARDELDRLIQRQLHPSKGMKGFEWRNGSKFPMSVYGGKPELNNRSQ